MTNEQKQKIYQLKNAGKSLTEISCELGQYRTKIVRQMRRQIFRQMKQKAE